jgi:hypothetical protein
MLVENKPHAPLASAEETSIYVRVVTFNIRYATASPFRGEELWTKRCPRLCAQLAYTSLHPASTFLCLQEVLHKQLLDILAALQDLNGDWTYVGVGREDGKQVGE